jgi:hypothetical protein
MGAKLRANQSERNTWSLETIWADLPGLRNLLLLKDWQGDMMILPCNLHHFPYGAGVLGPTLRAIMRCERGLWMQPALVGRIGQYMLPVTPRSRLPGFKAENWKVLELLYLYHKTYWNVVQWQARALFPNFLLTVEGKPRCKLNLLGDQKRFNTFGIKKLHLGILPLVAWPTRE